MYRILDSENLALLTTTTVIAAALLFTTASTVVPQRAYAATITSIQHPVSLSQTGRLQSSKYLLGSESDDSRRL